jgi:hypothetical protein
LLLLLRRYFRRITKDPARQSRNQISEYLPQRREGAKVLKKKNFFSELGVFAPSREKYPNPIFQLPRNSRYVASKIKLLNLRALRVLRGENYLLFFTGAGWFARLPSLR